MKFLSENQAVLAKSLTSSPSAFNMMLNHVIQFLSLTALSYAKSNSSPQCKAVPGSPSWPSDDAWTRLNHTLSGKLLHPSPPGAVCHPSQPTFNALACPAVQAGWLTTAWHADDPVSSQVNNWNNDTCLPIPTLPCSGEGYPVYVINATCAEDVKKGVDFARQKGVRLVVKGTGHDYLGRYVVLFTGVVESPLIDKNSGL